MNIPDLKVFKHVPLDATWRTRREEEEKQSPFRRLAGI